MRYRLDTCTDACTFSIQSSAYHLIRMSRGVSMRSGVRPIVCANWPHIFMGDAHEEPQKIKNQWCVELKPAPKRIRCQLSPQINMSLVCRVGQKKHKNIDVSTWNLHRRIYVFNSALTLPPHSYVARCVHAFGCSSDRLRKLTNDVHGWCARRTSTNKTNQWCVELKPAPKRIRFQLSPQINKSIVCRVGQKKKT